MRGGGGASEIREQGLDRVSERGDLDRVNVGI
jgi:hypothetical protein